jgi:hypothetical protein
MSPCTAAGPFVAGLLLPLVASVLVYSMAALCLTVSALVCAQ